MYFLATVLNNEPLDLKQHFARVVCGDFYTAGLEGFVEFEELGVYLFQGRHVEVATLLGRIHGDEWMAFEGAGYRGLVGCACVDEIFGLDHDSEMSGYHVENH